MANEFDLSFSVEYDSKLGSNAAFTVALANILRTQSTKKYVRHLQAIGITEEALDLGELSSLGWCVAMNLDETNYLELRSATGASNDIIRIDPLCFAVFRWGSDVTAPFAIANTAACNLDYIIWAP